MNDVKAIAAVGIGNPLKNFLSKPTNWTLNLAKPKAAGN